MDADVGKDRFCDSHAVMIDPPSPFTIDLCRHSLGQIAYHIPHRYHHRAPFRLLPLDASGLELTSLTAFFLIAIPSINDTVCDRSLHLEPKDSPFRTKIFIPLLLVSKVSQG